LLDACDEDGSSLPISILKRRPATLVTVLSREGCSLCVEAERSARRVFGRGAVRVIDIMSDASYEERFVFRVPVVFVNGRLCAEGRVTESELRAALRELPDHQASGSKSA
jgi:hypothetical protein